MQTLTEAYHSKDEAMASSALAGSSDLVHAYSLNKVLKLFCVVPVTHLDQVGELFSTAVFGPSELSKQVFEWVFTNNASIVTGIDALLEQGAQQQQHHQRQQQEASEQLQQANVLYNFDARSAKEMSVRAGEIVTVLQVLNGGWCKVAKADESTGAVPSSYLGLIPLSPRNKKNIPPPMFSPRMPDEPMPNDTALDRMILRYTEFEAMAFDALMEEQREKEKLEKRIEELEKRRRKAI